MSLKAYESFAEKPLEFPIGGKVYALPPLGIEAGLRLATVVAGEDEASKELKGEALWKLLLGPLWDEMIADDVPLAAATRAGLAALADYQYGRAMAEAAWEAGADPKALEAYITKKVAPNRASRRSRSTVKAPTTSSPAVSSGTSSLTT